MKKSRVLICLIMTLLMLLPASWVYADESEVAPAVDSEEGAELETPSEPEQTEEGQDIQGSQAADDMQSAAPSDISEEENSQEDTAAEEEKEEEEELIRIDDEALPMAEFTGGWALANLICMVLAALTGLAVLFRKQDGRESHISWTKALGSVVAICAAAVFLLTGDFTMPMVYTDAFTMPMAALALVNVAVLLFDLRRESRTN